MPRLDVNADVGEGFGQWTVGDDDRVVDVVTSVSIACGFHAGDPTVMRRLTRRATDAGVSIGAHVGHRDLFGFGRRALEVDPAVLRDEVLYQLAALVGAPARQAAR